ncbi:sulfotransferase family cytosolic 1B member 1-like [Mizuhopecten yessoensis]|uniref:sulfotransferase family cytosolic 1B member 1-like n=1 Tax=Mizuhopecten yessoensis TaxID=6573 RepID=UPI000B45952E|nr:sulfotransferase family cytosolic 1B member 1-like [Mizuhopecten yessoensis]
METVTVSDKDGASFDMYLCEGIQFPSFSKTDLKTTVNRFKYLQVRDDDVFIASYPKAGKHWIYEITNSLLTGSMDYLTSYATSGNTWETDFEDIKSPRIITSHFLFKHFPTELSSKKCRVIYITRNMKDSAVSFYSHMRKLGDSTGYSGTFEGFLPLFTSGQVPYGSWFHHTRQWEAVLQEHPNLSILYLEYEDMKRNLLTNIRKIAKFLGVEENEELFEKIVEKCDFKKMRSSGTFGAPWKSLTKDSTSPICRKGQVGDWKNWFTVAQNETFDEIYKKEMKDSKLKFEYTL